MTGAKFAVAALLSPVLVPIAVLADVGGVGVLQAVHDLTVVDAAVLFGVFGNGVAVIFFVARCIQRHLSTDEARHSEIQEDILKLTRSMEGFQVGTHARVALLLDRSTPPILATEIMEQEKACRARYCAGGGR